MRPPCEYVVKTYLPQVRARIIRNLIENYGWKPIDVSKTLMISLPSVTKYKRIINENAEISPDFAERVAKEATEMIVNGRVTPEQFVEFICSNCMVQRVDGEICKIHRNALPVLSDCQACTNAYNFVSGVSNKRLDVISNIMMAYQILSTIPNFDFLIPEVRTNIVMGIEDPKNEADVAGFPGRLTTVKGKLLAVTRPEFNASKHLSRILIAANKVDSRVRGLICIRYDSEIENAIKKTGLSISVFDRAQSDDGNIERFIESLKNVPDILIDKGGVGIEPIIYVFGKDAVDAANKILQIYKNLKLG